MKPPKKIINCAFPECGKEFTRYSTLQVHCSNKCKVAHKGEPKPKKPVAPIARLSGKRKKQEAQYQKLRIQFLAKPENKICFIDGCSRPANTIEHRAGRVGSNYLDTNTWAGCCWQHNGELENNPELSKQYQLSKIHGGKKI